jgi:AmpD protein
MDPRRAARAFAELRRAAQRDGGDAPGRALHQPAAREIRRLEPDGDPYFKGIHSMKVSAHFVVRRDGELLQFVPLQSRAWHAGVSSWRGRARCNDFSVGVELEGTDDTDYAPAQYQRLRELAHVLRNTLPLRDVAAHSDVAPGRKTDPGAHFDWARLLAALSVARP